MSLILTILIILSAINLLVATIAYVPSFLSKNARTLKEVGTIALSTTHKRKLYALVLGLSACLFLILTTTTQKEATMLIGACIVNITTIVISYITQIKLNRNLRHTHAAQSIAVIKLEGTTETPIELWLKKSNQDWPPINLEIGMGPWVVLATSIKTPLLEQIRSIFKQGDLLRKVALQENLKKILNDNGVTHTIDIDGSSCIPEVEEFFQKTLAKGL